MSAKPKLWEIVLEGPEVEWDHRRAPEYYKGGVVPSLEEDKPALRRKVVKPHRAVIQLEAENEEEARFLAKHMNPDYASFSFKSVREKRR